MSYPCVAFACNDSETGSFTERVTQITVDEALHLEGDSRFKIDWEGLAVIVDGRAFPTEGAFRWWTGNRCWNATRMNAAVLADLLNWLWARKWSVLEGDACFWARWEQGLVITAEEVAGMVGAG